MTVLLLVALACDKCGARCSVPEEAQWDARTARRAAERQGWQVVDGRRGSATDRCPAHRTIAPPKRPEGAVFHPPISIPKEK
ncbi:hypothetical protein C1I95_24695 [Micromonospora craterilacus]|uniref:Uncharacterized protein n=1 Tax=Micromonospora craterilacus TaxID=1655439 RepID=A0A2W2DLX4_9ACTN|nr:hypothetical protein [Micromonospora craterilacus]PZG12946.1 hypothetical protein C1I95_24695 [Micromonospora craterilacus]